jgi:dihydrofolate reductase
MISAIVAVDNNWGIGYNGELLESIPEDLKNFKALTSGHTVIMGRNTWDSLPKKPLPQRLNIIISRHTLPVPEGVLLMSMDEALAEIKKANPNEEIFIIGGGSIYQQLLPYCDRVYLTKINKSYDNIDTYFPNLDKANDWTIKPLKDLANYKDFTYQIYQYDRKN